MGRKVRRENYRYSSLVRRADALEEDMLGHQVAVKLCAPPEEVRGTLNQQSVVGVWIVTSGSTLDGGAQKFYPMHRVVEIRDEGYRGR